MAALKDLFKDYLVTYTTSPKTINFEEETHREIPTNKYQNLLTFMSSKKSQEKDSKPVEKLEEISQDFKWTYVHPESIIESLYTDSSKWVKDMADAYKRLGLNDNAIKNLIAKNSIESNWGNSNLAKNYNFGGITAGRHWKGKTVKAGDKNAKGEAITQTFRAYNNIDEYVKDEIALLTRLYDFNQDDDISTFLDKLQGKNKDGRKYAENPSYKNIVKSRYYKL